MAISSKTPNFSSETPSFTIKTPLFIGNLQAFYWRFQRHQIIVGDSHIFIRDFYHKPPNFLRTPDFLWGIFISDPKRFIGAHNSNSIWVSNENLKNFDENLGVFEINLGVFNYFPERAFSLYTLLHKHLEDLHFVFEINQLVL